MDQTNNAIALSEDWARNLQALVAADEGGLTADKIPSQDALKAMESAGFVGYTRDENQLYRLTGPGRAFAISVFGAEDWDQVLATVTDISNGSIAPEDMVYDAAGNPVLGTEIEGSTEGYFGNVLNRIKDYIARGKASDSAERFSTAAGEKFHEATAKLLGDTTTDKPSDALDIKLSDNQKLGTYYNRVGAVKAKDLIRELNDFIGFSRLVQKELNPWQNETLKAFGDYSAQAVDKPKEALAALTKFLDRPLKGTGLTSDFKEKKVTKNSRGDEVQQGMTRQYLETVMFARSYTGNVVYDYVNWIGFGKARTTIVNDKRVHSVSDCFSRDDINKMLVLLDTLFGLIQAQRKQYREYYDNMDAIYDRWVAFDKKVSKFTGDDLDAARRANFAIGDFCANAQSSYERLLYTMITIYNSCQYICQASVKRFK